MLCFIFSTSKTSLHYFPGMHSFWWVVHSLHTVYFFFITDFHQIFLWSVLIFKKCLLCLKWFQLPIAIHLYPMWKFFSLLFCPPLSSPSRIPITHHVRLFDTVFMLCSFFQCFSLHALIWIVISLYLHILIILFASTYLNPWTDLNNSLNDLSCYFHHLCYFWFCFCWLCFHLSVNQMFLLLCILGMTLLDVRFLWCFLN